ncbi:deoxyribonuclease V [filamentous cyanobacterium CCP2]|nr:deoxyribonuclease V [filamentous cyanobacterium CCP2]
MEIYHSHAWDLSREAAIALQQTLRDKIITTDQLGEIHTVAGVDVGFEDAGNTTRAAVVVLSFPELQVQERAIARRPTSFPYIPGLLSFREVPAVLDALDKLNTLPDLLLCDGQGTAHPRRFGIACHVGLLTNMPAIGVAKSLLVGKHEEVADEKGAWQPLQHKGEVIGVALRTRPKTKPLYISPGHRISLETSIAYVLQCTTKYRLPETTRQAHKLASETPASELENLNPETNQLKLF